MRKRSTAEKIIRRRMEDENVTMDDLALCFRVSTRTIYSWLREPLLMTAANLNAIADILHMTDEEFMAMTRRKS